MLFIKRMVDWYQDISEIIIYESVDGEMTVRLEGESLWLTQEQMSKLFERERSVITKHLRNVFREEELEESSVCAFFAHTAVDGKTYQTRHYNLDAIISVGYRVNSKRGMQFRQWATGILRGHLIQGWTVDRARFEHNAAELEALLVGWGEAGTLTCVNERESYRPIVAYLSGL